MNTQQVFDKVATHLITQNEKAQDQSTGDCVYRTDDGKACAIGCLISDDSYADFIEGGDIFHLMDIDIIPDTLDDMTNRSELGRFFDYLRHVHDDCPVTSWPYILRGVAQDYDLTTPTCIQ